MLFHNIFILKSSVVFADVSMRNAGVHELTGRLTGRLFLLNSVVSCSSLQKISGLFLVGWLVVVWCFFPKIKYSILYTTDNGVI